MQARGWAVGEAFTISELKGFVLFTILQRLCVLSVLQLKTAKDEWTLLFVVDGSQQWAMTWKQKQRSD